MAGSLEERIDSVAAALRSRDTSSVFALRGGEWTASAAQRAERRFSEFGRVVVVSDPTVPPGGLWLALCRALEAGEGHGDPRRRFRRALGGAAAAGECVVVMVPEAAALPASSLAALVATAEAETALRVVLVEAPDARLTGPLPADARIFDAAVAPEGAHQDEPEVVAVTEVAASAAGADADVVGRAVFEPTPTAEPSRTEPTLASATLETPGVADQPETTGVSLPTTASAPAEPVPSSEGARPEPASAGLAAKAEAERVEAAPTPPPIVSPGPGLDEPQTVQGASPLHRWQSTVKRDPSPWAALAVVAALGIWLLVPADPTPPDAAEVELATNTSGPVAVAARAPDPAMTPPQARPGGDDVPGVSAPPPAQAANPAQPAAPISDGTATPPQAPEAALPSADPAGADPTDAPSDLVADDELAAALHINATPWARIEIDGRYLGETPLGGIRLTPGYHTIRATFADGTSQRRSVHSNENERYLAFVR